MRTLTDGSFIRAGRMAERRGSIVPSVGNLMEGRWFVSSQGLSRLHIYPSSGTHTVYKWCMRRRRSESHPLRGCCVNSNAEILSLN